MYVIVILCNNISLSNHLGNSAKITKGTQNCILTRFMDLSHYQYHTKAHSISQHGEKQETKVK